MLQIFAATFEAVHPWRMGDESSEGSSEDSFSYKNRARRAFETAKRKIAAVKPSATSAYEVDFLSDSDDGSGTSVAVVPRKTGNSKRWSVRQGASRKSKRLKVLGGCSPQIVEVNGVYSSDSDSISDAIGYPSTLSPARLPSRAGKNPMVETLDSEESDRDANAKTVLTVSDSSDVELVTTSDAELIHEKERNDENEVISIKISWKFQPVQKFQLRKHQKFKVLMDHFARLEGVPLQKIVIYGGKHNSRLIEPFDTPDTVGITVTDILEGGVLLEGGEARAQRQRGLVGQHSDGIRVRVQVEGVRSFPVVIGRGQRMQVLLVKVAEQMEVDVARVRLFLDGEAICSESIPRDLDLEEDDVLDLRLL